MRARLNALSRAHDLIRDDGKERTGSLFSLLRRLISPYADECDDRISIQGDDVVLSARAITSVTLILHEIITNAAKYGALARSNAKLVVRVQQNADWQEIGWEERFANDVTGEMGEGFGSRLLKTLIENQLHGSITRKLTGQGLAIHIRIPASAL